MMRLVFKEEKSIELKRNNMNKKSDTCGSKFEVCIV